MFQNKNGDIQPQVMSRKLNNKKHPSRLDKTRSTEEYRDDITVAQQRRTQYRKLQSRKIREDIDRGIYRNAGMGVKHG